MKRALVIVSLAGMLAGAGCQAVPQAKVAGGDARLATADSAAYLDEMSSKPEVTQLDAAKGMLLLLGEDQDVTFTEAVGKLRERKIAGAAWRFQAHRPTSKGRLAYMIYQACGLRGGLTLTVFGPSRRYCLKELQYRGLMTSGLPYNAVSGMEIVSVLTRADELRRTGKVSRTLSMEGGEQ